MTRALLLAALACAAPAKADPPLGEMVAFTGAIAFLGSGAPGLVIAAVRNGETAFAGFAAQIATPADLASPTARRKKLRLTPEPPKSGRSPRKTFFTPVSIW